MLRITKENCEIFFITGIDAKASYRFKMATLNKSEYVLDQLVCFLSNPLFQIPVLSFMETKCLSNYNSFTI